MNSQQWVTWGSTALLFVVMVGDFGGDDFPRGKLSPAGKSAEVQKGRVRGKVGIVFSCVGFKLGWRQNHLEGLLKTQIARLHPQSFCSSRFRVGPKNVHF